MRRARTKATLGRLVLQEGRHRLLDEAAASVATRAVEGIDEVPAGAAPFVDATGRSRYGIASEKLLLSYWLRDDDDNSLESASAGGIASDELSVIMQRDRALQAGQRVADEIEARLLQDAVADAGDDVVACATGGGAEADIHRGVQSATQSDDGVSRRLAVASSPTPPTPSPKTTSVHSHMKNSGITPNAPVPRAVLASCAEEQAHWEAVAAAAPFTPSKGAAYEFVYHAASRGLIPLIGGTQTVNN